MEDIICKWINYYIGEIFCRCDGKELMNLSERRQNLIFEKGVIGEKLKALSIYDDNSFNEAELKVMNFVIEYFKNFTCKQISEYSHKEKPYRKTRDNERISYEFSSELSLNLS